MTDPIQSAMDELNEAVANRDRIHTELTDDGFASWAHRKNADMLVDHFRKKYNALIVAYGGDE